MHMHVTAIFCAGEWFMFFFARKLVKRLLVLFVAMLAIIKVNSVCLMLISMLISLWAYAVAFGFQYGLGFLLLLFVHELGHIIAARVVGIRARLPIFIPFIGAAVALQKLPVNAKMAANIAIGGPALGTISAVGCLIWYFWSDSLLMLVLAYTAAILNLLNLIPSEPFDGGKIAGAIAPRLWLVGTMILSGLFLYTQNGIVLIILVFSSFYLWRSAAIDKHDAYYALRKRVRMKVFLWYVGLVVVLAVLTFYIANLLH